MERVKKGEKYWYLILYGDGITAAPTVDFYRGCNKEMFKFGNYFHTQEEAEVMARKLRAVLKGADVIEMPSEEEFELVAELEYPTGTDDYLCDKGIKLAQMAFNSGVNWLKSKIVK